MEIIDLKTKEEVLERLRSLEREYPRYHVTSEEITHVESVAGDEVVQVPQGLKFGGMLLVNVDVEADVGLNYGNTGLSDYP
jgi:hypothetical protein